VELSISHDVVVASASVENKMIVVADQGERGVLCRSQAQFGTQLCGLGNCGDE